MATLAGPRAQFTWALNQYNLSEDSDTRAKFARRMVKYIAALPNNSLTVSEVTHGQSYPSEVDQLVDDRVRPMIPELPRNKQLSWLRRS